MKKSELISFVKYALVGVLGLVVDLGIFYFLNKLLGVNYMFANVTSSSLAVVHNFVLNSYFTFRVTDNFWKRFASFYLVALIGMGISTMLLALMVHWLDMDTMLAKLITVFVVAMIQYFINKKITFSAKLSNPN